LQASSIRHPASGNELILELGSGVEMVFVRIPAGEFLMGEGSSQREMYLDEYWMGKYPVVRVSMHDADAFCEWATQVTGHVIQLPTEAQWEKAARGTDGRTYPWGDEEPTHHHCTFNSGGTTQVGLYSPLGDSPYGCADMAGNVWEWCGGSVLRGGSWCDSEWYVRGANRDRDGPTYTCGISGFRCVAVGAPGG
jgi:formylglycine-generating enzyme required for sulfatase activity